MPASKKQSARINRDVQMNTISAAEDSKEDFVCQTCGKHYKRRKGNFSPIKSQLYAGTDGYMNTCKNCVNVLFDRYTEFFDGNEEKAIERICQIFDIYYNAEAVATTKKISEDRSRVSAYISKIQIRQFAGKTYTDTIIETKSDAITSLNDLENNDALSDSDISPKQMKKLIREWGMGFEVDDYKILSDSFDDWKSRIIIDGKTRESLVRELCIIKLQMNKALRDENVELYTKLMSTYQSTLKSANLQPKQEDENEKASEKPIGVMIEMFENERPISKTEPKFEDVSHYVRFITIYFLGHLCKMLKIKNKYSALYEEEMAKYRVEFSELENANDDDVFDYILNGGFSDEQE